MNLSNKIKLTKDMNTQVKADKLSITLSLACMIHCLLMPSFLILTSGFLALSIDNEFIHKVFLIIVLPVSLYALIAGYRNHKILSYLYLGVSGLWLLIFAVFFWRGRFWRICRAIIDFGRFNYSSLLTLSKLSSMQKA